MKESRVGAEKIIAIPKEAEADRKVADLGRQQEISQATIYARKAKYGGMDVTEARPLQQMEEENRRLKQLVTELRLDIRKPSRP